MVEANTVDPLAAQLATFDLRKTELLRAGHRGKWVLIYADRVAGLYGSRQEGLVDGYRRFGNVPFLVREVRERDRPLRARPAAIAF